MTPEQDVLETYIDTAAELMALPVEPAWKPAVAGWASARPVRARN